MNELCSSSSFYAFKEQIALFLPYWQIVVIYSGLHRNGGLWEKVSFYFSTLHPTPIHTNIHSLTKHICCVLSQCTLPFLRLSCCLSAASLGFLNRICHGWREMGAMFVVPARLPPPPPRRKALIVSSQEKGLPRAPTKPVIMWDKTTHWTHDREAHCHCGPSLLVEAHSHTVKKVNGHYTALRPFWRGCLKPDTKLRRSCRREGPQQTHTAWRAVRVSAHENCSKRRGGIAVCGRVPSCSHFALFLRFP